jgi:hypothetical protein
MRKTTFVCEPCHRTWTYPLAVEIAELYAAEAPVSEEADRPTVEPMPTDDPVALVEWGKRFVQDH